MVERHSRQMIIARLAEILNGGCATENARFLSKYLHNNWSVFGKGLVIKLTRKVHSLIIQNYRQLAPVMQYLNR